MLAADDDGSNWGKLVPLLIFFVIWAVSAISKAVQKGKKGDEIEQQPSEESDEQSFDDLAKKIRERYQQAKEEAMKKQESRQGGQTGQQPPARQTKEIPSPRPASSITRTEYPAIPKSPSFEKTVSSAGASEGPTIRVVKTLEKPSVNVELGLQKPMLEKVEPGLEKVEGITPDVPMVTTEVGMKQSHYLAELAEHYSSTDGLRKAILNYEILGPPVGLRQQNQ